MCGSCAGVNIGKIYESILNLSRQSCTAVHLLDHGHVYDQVHGDHDHQMLPKAPLASIWIGATFCSVHVFYHLSSAHFVYV